MSPRGRPVSMPPSLRPRAHQRDAAIITPHRLVAQRASAVLERADVHARTSPVRVPAPAIVERCSDESLPTRAQRVDLWATPARVRHRFHRRPVAAAHSPCLSRPPERMWTDGRRLWPPERRTRVHGPTRHDSANPPRRPPRDGTAHAHIRPSRADLGGPHRRLPPGLPGPAVPVPQHRPRPDRVWCEKAAEARSVLVESPK